MCYLQLFQIPRCTHAEDCAPSSRHNSKNLVHSSVKNYCLLTKIQRWDTDKSVGKTAKIIKERVALSLPHINTKHFCLLHPSNILWTPSSRVALYHSSVWPEACSGEYPGYFLLFRAFHSKKYLLTSNIIMCKMWSFNSQNSGKEHHYNLDYAKWSQWHVIKSLQNCYLYRHPHVDTHTCMHACTRAHKDYTQTPYRSSVRIMYSYLEKQLLKLVQMGWCKMSSVAQNLWQSASKGHFSKVQQSIDDGVQVNLELVFCTPQTHLAPQHWINLINIFLSMWIPNLTSILQNW